MTTPDRPLRADASAEIPGTPEQIWAAIATSGGISSWFLHTELDGRVGGSIHTHMGDDTSTGTVTDWDPPRRFAYEEDIDWATLTGHVDAQATPLVTEFLVEARSGGTCVVRVVSSAFGSGADWEDEFFEGMERMWVPFLDNLRLYLTHFPGQYATSLSAQVNVPGDSDAVFARLRRTVGAGSVGEPVEVLGLSGHVERIGKADLLLRIEEPVTGYVQLMTSALGPESTWTEGEGYLFSDPARDYVERQQSAWRDWLEQLAAPTS
jgi:uncharacterized protein YndB with AHSA1/START domain